MLRSLVVRLKRMGNFKWIEIVISLLGLSLTFQLKANGLHANEGHTSNTKDSCIIRISIFGPFSAGKKCILYMDKYGISGPNSAKN